MLFALQVFLCLPLDKFTLEHLLLELLDEVELEVFELLADVLRVDLLELVLLLELGAHLLIVLGHLGLLDLDPMALDILSNCLLAAGHYLLSLLLVRHVAHEHLTLEGLNHVLLLVHRFIRTLNLLATKLILIVLLFSVQYSTIDLI